MFSQYGGSGGDMRLSFNETKFERFKKWFEERKLLWNIMQQTVDPDEGKGLAVLTQGFKWMVVVPYTKFNLKL